MPEYLSVSEFAEKYNKQRNVVLLNIADGRIPAIKVGKSWIIPADATPPPDRRVKSGKYVGWREKYPKKEKEEGQ